MAIGYFTLSGTYLAYGDTPASGTVQIDGIPQVIVDTAGDKIKVGPKKVTLDNTGSFTIQLPTNSTSGDSTTIGYRVTARLKHANVEPVTFWAKAPNATLDMADVTPQDVQPFSATAANAAAAAVSASAAAASATAAATSAAAAAAAASSGGGGGGGGGGAPVGGSAADAAARGAATLAALTVLDGGTATSRDGVAIDGGTASSTDSDPTFDDGSAAA